MLRKPLLQMIMVLICLTLATPVLAQRTKEKVAMNRQYIDELFARVEALEGKLAALPETMDQLQAQIEQLVAQNARDGELQRRDLLALQQHVERLAEQLEELRYRPVTPSFPPEAGNPMAQVPAPASPDATPAPEKEPEADSLVPVASEEQDDLTMPPPLEAAAPGPEENAAEAEEGMPVPREEAPPEPMETPAAEPGPEPAAETEEEPGPDATEILRQARADLLRGRYSLAREGFDQVLALQPPAALAAEALFGKAQAHQSQGDFEEALVLFQQVPREYPDSRAAPAALLRAGQTLNGLGRREQAGQVLDQLRRQYPESEEARLAALGSSLRQD